MNQITWENVSPEIDVNWLAREKTYHSVEVAVTIKTRN